MARRLLAAVCIAGLLSAGSGGTITAARAARAARAAPARLVRDVPAGFWSGTDSTVMTVPGPAPYREPVLGGAYGGYVGMIGNWAAWQHCGGQVVWSAADSAAADINFTTYRQGIGTGVYWFMAGPGVDPHYNGSRTEAYDWGAAQAARTLADLGHPPGRVSYPVVFMDVELPGNAPSFTPAPDNGWNSVYTSACSGRVRSTFIPARVDRADLNGFASYVAAHSARKVGVYSAPVVWSAIFGRGRAAAIPGTYEWTYNGDASSLARRPAGWCLRSTATCAHFFGGVTRSSPRAVMWQWSGGGGTFNGYGDFDQIDANRTP